LGECVAFVETRVRGDVRGCFGRDGQAGVGSGDAGGCCAHAEREAMTFGKTRKDGAAPVMQAAAEENVKAGFEKEKQSAESEPELRVQLVDEGVVQRG
jgi:hypothetical protein